MQSQAHSGDVLYSQVIKLMQSQLQEENLGKEDSPLEEHWSIIRRKGAKRCGREKK